jgi:vitamin B12 transporter
MKKFFFISFFIFFLFNITSAQESIVQKTDSVGFYKLTDVVISATKTSVNTIELANSISTIDSTEIVNRNKNNVFDLLKNEYGLSFTRQAGHGTLSNVYLRGANTGHTLVLIDGVEYNLPNDPSGFFDFSSLSSDNIEKIEVLRGPQSTIYGSDALAGVINIITKKGSGNPKYSASVEGGSYKTYKGLAGLNGSYNKLNFSLTFSKVKNDGFSAASDKYGEREKDGFELLNFSSLIGYQISDKVEVNLLARYGNSEADYDRSGGISGDDPTYIFYQEEFSIRGEAKVKLYENKWIQKFSASIFNNIRKYSYDTSAASINYPAYEYDYSRSRYDGRKYKLDWQNDIQLNKSNLFTLGTEFELEESATEFFAYNYVPDPFYPDIESIIPKRDTKTIGIFLQDQLQFGKNFYTTAGLRIDHHSKFGTAVTYRIAPAFVLWKTGTKFKVTFGTGFKSPSLYYLFDPQYGNPGLSPEKNFGWDAGIEQYFWSDGFSIGATYFSNNFSNMFGFDPVTFKTININKAETNGLEIFVKAMPFSELELKTNYTFTNALDKSAGSADYDKKLIRRPAHKAGFYFSYTFLNRFNINSEIIYVGNREDTDFSTFSRVVLKDYTIVNISARYDVFSFFSLNARIENLFDKQYEEIYGYGTPGLSAYAGLKLTIN